MFTVAGDQLAHRTSREANELDSAANARAIDSLINYETVSTSTTRSSKRGAYDERIAEGTKAQVTNQYPVGAERRPGGDHRGRGDGDDVAGGDRGANGGETIGDIVLVNAFMIQLTSRSTSSACSAARSANRSPTSSACSASCTRTARSPTPRRPHPAHRAGEVRFENSFAYDAKRPILFDVDFDIPAGGTVAVVGHPARANPRSPACCIASTTCKAGAVHQRPRPAA